MSGSSRWPGRTCGLDPGRVRIGVAVDDDLGVFAHRRGVLNARDQAGVLAALARMVQEDGVKQFVVGLPLEMCGVEGRSAREARALAQRVADATSCKVELWDERLTSVEAQRVLASVDIRGKKARARIDEAAACAILQSWLDARANR